MLSVYLYVAVIVDGENVGIVGRQPVAFSGIRPDRTVIVGVVSSNPDAASDCSENGRADLHNHVVSDRWFQEDEVKVDWSVWNNKEVLFFHFEFSNHH